MLRYRRIAIDTRAMYREARDKASGRGCEEKLRTTRTCPVAEVVTQHGKRRETNLGLLMLHDMTIGMKVKSADETCFSA